MFLSNEDNLPRKRAKQQAKATKSGILDTSVAVADNAATTADIKETVTALAERVAELEAASTSTTK